MYRWSSGKALFRQAHIADEDLLLFLDGEMKPWKAEKVRRHLESCWTCRAQRQKIEQTISSYVQALKAAEGKAEPPKGWREFETRLEHFDRDLAGGGETVHAGFRLPWRMTILGLAVFGCLAAAGWFALPRTSEVVEKGSDRIPAAPMPGAPEKAEQSAAPNEIRPGAIASARMLQQPSREEVLAKAIEIEYALHRLRACLGGEVRVMMEANGLRIAGEPGSPERERELQTALGAVSMPAWVTRESGRPRRAESKAVTAEVRVAESGTAAAPPAEDAVRTYLQAHPEAAGSPGGDRAAMAANYSSRVLSNASAAVREAWALRRLAETYPTEGMPSNSRWLLETMLRDHMRELSGDVGRSADLIAPVFGLSKTPAPEFAEAGSWQQKTERVFKGVEDFERRASALFGDATEPIVRAEPAADSAAALMAGAGEILRRLEFLDRTITLAFSTARGRARGDGMRN